MLRTLPRSEEKELLDREDLDPEELRENLRDLTRVGRWAGGIRSILSDLAPRLTAWPRDRELRILDVGVGGADLPLALSLHCRRRGIRVFIVGLDRGHQILDIARERVGPRPWIRLVRGDALDLPFLPGSFDFVVCSLLLHHVPPSRGPDLLREMALLARGGVLVSDLRRGRWEYLCTFLFSRLFLRGRMARRDALLSVLRAPTVCEARSLLAEAGWTQGRVEKIFPLRIRLRSRSTP